MFSAFALIVVLHDLLIFTSAEPTCCQKGQQYYVLACPLSFLIWKVERVVALAQRLKNDAIFIHLIQTGEKLASDVL
ncbi:hypothetical protein D3C76_1658980 [compost metagenome]